MNVNITNGSATVAVDVSHVVRTKVPVPAAKKVETLEAPTPKDTVQIETTGSPIAAVDPANVRSGLRLRVDDATDRIVVQILNANDEVIRQLPPEELLQASARFREITGKIFDEFA